MSAVHPRLLRHHPAFLRTHLHRPRRSCRHTPLSRRRRCRSSARGADACGNGSRSALSCTVRTLARAFSPRRYGQILHHRPACRCDVLESTPLHASYGGYGNGAHTPHLPAARHRHCRVPQQPHGLCHSLSHIRPECDARVYHRDRPHVYLFLSARMDSRARNDKADRHDPARTDAWTRHVLTLHPSDSRGGTRRTGKGLCDRAARTRHHGARDPVPQCPEEHHGHCHHAHGHLHRFAPRRHGDY